MRYDDILPREPPVLRHPRMPVEARAAQFSPFATTNVHIYCCFSCGTSALTALRPPLPTMSPMNSKLSVGPFKFILLKNSRFDLKNE